MYLLVFRKYDVQGRPVDSERLIEREVERLTDATSHITELQAQGYELESAARA